MRQLTNWQIDKLTNLLINLLANYFFSYLCPLKAVFLTQ